MLEWTGERYVPWMEGAEIGYEHLHRYAFATQFVRNKRVLDLASGEGYGSYLLAKTAKQVVGIDIDEQTVRHAKNKYIRPNLDFKVGSILEVPIEGNSFFDVIVCFEALEHVGDHHKLLSEAKRLLTPNGLFLVSTPNKMLYTDEPHFNNPFHVHELYFDEFKALLENYFRQVKFLGQRIHCTSNMWPLSQRQEQISKLSELMKQKEQRLSDLSQNLTQTQTNYTRDVTWLQSVLADRQNAVTAQASEISRLSAEVATIHFSHAWKAVTFYYRVRDRLLPEGTFRRNVVKGLFRSALAFRSAVKSQKALPAST